MGVRLHLDELLPPLPVRHGLLLVLGTLVAPPGLGHWCDVEEQPTHQRSQSQIRLVARTWRRRVAWEMEASVILALPSLDRLRALTLHHAIRTLMPRVLRLAHKVQH